MTDPQRIVQLSRAWCWTCPDCQTLNYVQSPNVTFDKADEGSVRVMLGLDEWEPIPEGFEGEFIWAPETVCCTKCQIELPCFDPDFDPDVEEDDEEDADDLSGERVPDVLPEDL